MPPEELEATADGAEAPPPNGEDTGDDKLDLSAEIQASIDARRASPDPETEETITAEATETPPAAEAEDGAAAATDGAEATGEPGATMPEAADTTTAKDDVTDDASVAAEGELNKGDDDEIPEGLSESARERFHTLANERNALREERDSAVQNYEGVATMIADSGTDARGFAEMLDYSKRRSIGDFKGALAILDGHRREIALQIGPEAAGVDFLQQHQDLQQRVETLDLTPETARELAMLREQQALAQTRQQAAAAQATNVQASQQYTEAVNQAAAQVSALEAQWQKNPDYRAIAGADGMAAKIKDICAHFPVGEWVQRVTNEYTSAEAMLKGYQRRQPKPPTAITGPGSRSTGNAEPATMEDAIQAAINERRQSVG